MRFKHETITTSYAISPAYSTSLGRLFKPGPVSPESPSAFQAIHNNDEALAWRIGLIENAEKSIDAQYYCWHADVSGMVLINKLIEAADRGVRVRLLLDDIHTFGADRRIATLNGHRNIEVRLFNPFRLRWTIRLFWLLEFLLNIERLNHRMHNKLLIADNIVSIIGGRNIGDAYFGLDKNYIFRDLDLLTCGPVVDQFSKSFDLFWNSQISKTARRIIAFRPRRLDFRHMKKQLKKALLRNQHIIQRIENLVLSLFSRAGLADSLTPATAQVFYDLPERGDTGWGHIANSLYQCGINTTSQLTIVSAYFVPDNNLLVSLQNIIDRGVKIRIFTNSLASIDVTAAFSGYQHCRLKLLSLGIELYEFRASPVFHSIYTTPAVNVKHFGLHAKTIIYDTDTVYVGTLNLDPRSASLNTEIGVLVESRKLADDIRHTFNEDFAEGQFWRVTCGPDNRLLWTCGTDSTHLQPATGPLQRLANLIYSLLPIKHHL